MREQPKKEMSTKVCPKCSTEKNITEFGRDASRPDGRYTYCKLCRRNPNRKDKVVLELAAKGLKTCTLCLAVKPFSAFDKDSTKSLGVTSRCKKCHREARRLRAAEWHEDHDYVARLEIEGYARCYSCRTVKPLAAFLKNKNYRTGYCRLCLQCNNNIRAGYRLTRKKSSRDYTRWEVFEDDDFTCYLCEDVLSPEMPVGHPKSLSIDHVEPVSRGGLDERSNVRTACLGCNQAKNDLPLEEFLVKIA